MNVEQMSFFGMHNAISLFVSIGKVGMVDGDDDRRHRPGNGDVLSYEEYYEHLEKRHVDGIMFGRGALVPLFLISFLTATMWYRGGFLTPTFLLG